MLNAMSAFIDGRERIVTIEDSAELQLQQRHVVRLETRPANIEGKGEIVQRDLVKNALRMRPDRIIVGEVRAGEAFDMLQAMTLRRNVKATDAVMDSAACIAIDEAENRLHVQKAVMAALVAQRPPRAEG